VDFPPDHAQSEAPEKMPDPGLPPAERIGYAVVGLGRMTVGRLPPALAKSKYSRLSALVSGDRAKALALARQYGLAEQSIYNYANFDAITANPDVQVVYIVLPNSMHAQADKIPLLAALLTSLALIHLLCAPALSGARTGWWNRSGAAGRSTL
jgi:hypothetical protein